MGLVPQQVDYGNILCSSVNKLQENSNASAKEDYCLYSTKINCLAVDSSGLDFNL